MTVRKKQEKTENISLFQRLHDDLAKIIETTPAGEKLKSEPELAASLGVSRATLREAMRSFEGQGLIRRRQGIGTFVLDHKQNITTGLEILESIETQAKRLGLNVSMGYLSIHKVEPDAKLAEQIGVPEIKDLIKISRVIWVEERPVAYLIDYVADGIFNREDLSKGFTGSVLDLLIQRGTPKLSYSNTVILAVPAITDTAKRLQLQRGDVLQKLDAWLYDEDDRMIDYSESYFVPGFFKFHVIRQIGN